MVIGKITNIIAKSSNLGLYNFFNFATYATDIFSAYSKNQ
jgi:hypothetical protein